jgi:predicted NBD/HSP70 family sugar kinase
MTRTGDNSYIKELNYKLVLDTIRNRGSVSRVELSRLTGLTRSTCSLICDRMIRQGVVLETGKGGSTGGRPMIMLEINVMAGAVVGLKMMDDRFACAVVDLGGNILHQRTADIARHQDQDTYLSAFENYITGILVEHREAYGTVPIIGIGIALSGRISADEGVLIESSVFGWSDVAIGERLKKRFDLPIYLENDVNTFAMGEKYFGVARELDTFLCLSVGEGVGLGIIIDGKLYKGSHHGAGEIGHTKLTLDPDAPVCACGRRGCLEAFVADQALIAGYEERTGNRISVGELRARATSGDIHALEVFERAGVYLGTAVSTLINLFDPQAIIVGGEGAEAAGFFLPAMKRHIEMNTVYGLSREVEITVLQPSNDDWIRGVAALAIGEFFSSDNLLGER